MDVVNAQIKSQSSICSESTADEAPSRTASTILDRRICLVGDLQNDVPLRRAADTFDVPVVTSNDGREYIDGSFSTVFVVKEFEGDIFTYLSRAKQCILGPPALQQLAQQEKPLPCNTRPLYNLAMNGVVLCLTGFKVKDELQKLVPLIHHMGGSIRKDVSEKVTHLIANVVGGEKYIYAKTFRVPTMNRQWVYDSWERRNDLDFRATQDKIINEHKLNVFHGVKVCFFGFAGDEERHMTEVLIENGGTATTTDDPSCTHVVVDEQQGRGERPGGFGGRAHIVRAEWFWTSVQKEYCLEETDYIVDEVSSLPPFWKLRRMLNMRAAQVQRPPASPVRINNNDYDCDFVTVTMDIDQFQEADCPTCCIIN